MFLVLICLFANANGMNIHIPETFLLGVGTSAYQSEGAWNEHGTSLINSNILSVWNLIRSQIFLTVSSENQLTKISDKILSMGDILLEYFTNISRFQIITPMKSYHLGENIWWSSILTAFEWSNRSPHGLHQKLPQARKSLCKGPSVWDTMVHTHPELISNHSTGDIACDSYHFAKQDADNALRLWSDHFHFSISWSRLLPYGTPDYINPWAADYYYNMINYLRERRMEPVISMYHWDLPQVLQDQGGWLNPNMVDHFVNYARVIIELYGYSSSYFITINDPLAACVTTYDLDQGAPPVEKSPGIGCYLCGRHILLAHAKVFRMLRKEYENRFCEIGIGLNAIWAEPKTNTPQDRAAADREMQMTLGWWMQALNLYDNNYPELMKSRVDYLSDTEGFAESRLLPFTTEELSILRGAYDFFGINHFNSYLISSATIPDDDAPSFDKDKGTIREIDPEWGLIGYPVGLRKLLNYIRNTYGNPQVLLATGYENDNIDVDDENRTNFVKHFVSQTIQALNDDFCEVIGFTYWSLMDQMEWRKGYTSKFGLYHVDFSDPNRTRTPRKSLETYSGIVANRVVEKL